MILNFKTKIVILNVSVRRESDRTSIVHCIQKIVFALLIFIVTLVLEMWGEF